MNASHGRERGAVGTIVATLLALGVIFGALTFAVDTGQLMYERTQQQNSADASALSLARSCATSVNTCVPGANSLSTINNANSFDNENAFVSQCRSASVPANPSNPLPVCGTVPNTTSDASWTNCPDLPAKYQTAAFANLPYVEVRTRTQVSGLRNWFAAISGGSSTSSVAACSRAAWGAPSGAVAGELPIAISACEWSKATNNGSAYVVPPDYTTYPTITTGSPSATYPAGYGGSGTQKWPGGAVPAPNYNVGNEVVVLVQNPPGGQTPPSTCPSWNGHALPGGFSILESLSTDPCKLVINTGWVKTDPGNSTGCNLQQFVGKVVSIPVFDCTNDTNPGVNSVAGLTCTAGTGSNAYYHVMSMAKVYLSGYSVTTSGGIPNKVSSINPNTSGPPTLPNNANPCENSASCLSGWFTTGVAGGGGGGLGGGQGFGAFVVVPVG